jgi:hypothetical protein
LLSCPSCSYTINLPALFELRAAGWSVEIQLSEQDWGLEAPAVYFTCRKALSDDSPGINADDNVVQAAWDEIRAFAEKWDGFNDSLDYFKNPKPIAWKFDPWRDWDGDDFHKNYERS